VVGIGGFALENGVVKDIVAKYACTLYFVFGINIIPVTYPNALFGYMHWEAWHCIGLNVKIPWY
jgi:hypothetical protein